MSWSCDIGDGPSVYREEERTAAKEHACVECNAPILKGERHLYYRGLWDGSWSDGRQHLLCRDACVWIRDVLEGECVAFGALTDWWEEHRRSADCEPYGRPRRAIRGRWRIGARMFALVRRRERLARAESAEVAA